tara:strand:- start:161 stop:457 length:297 start_codon:yes stop_codon:yes gene_type:complete
MAQYSIMIVMDKKPEGPTRLTIIEVSSAELYAACGIVIGGILGILFYIVVVLPTEVDADDCIARGGKIYRDAYIVARSIDGAIGMVKESNKCMVVDHD